MQRRDAILQSACDHFGRFGFRGASLRDIARDAGVSLTLLNHHFGCKSALLSAAVSTQASMLRERMEALNRLRSAGVGAFTPSDLVRAWIGPGFETAARPDGLAFLRVLARVMDDPAEHGVSVLGKELDEAALGFVEALMDCYPEASYHAAVSAWVCVNASLSKLLTIDGRLEQIGAVGHARPPARDRAWLERFLVAGIDAALSAMHVEPGVDDDQPVETTAGEPEAALPDFAAMPPRWEPINVLASAGS